MKRINQKTKEPFRRGDERGDGFLFHSYILTKPVKRNGYYLERWISKKSYEKMRKRAKSTDDARREKVTKEFQKRINPKTNKIFSFGFFDKKTKKYFSHYKYSGDPKTKLRDEYWQNFEEIREKYLKKMLSRTKAKCQTANIKFNLSLDYLHNIYPKDNKCPIFKKEFKIGDPKKQFSPSLDRIYPERGYVIGNVVIISNRANTIKNNATSEEIMKVANWLLEND